MPSRYKRMNRDSVGEGAFRTRPPFPNLQIPKQSVLKGAVRHGPRKILPRAVRHGPQELLLPFPVQGSVRHGPHMHTITVKRKPGISSNRSPKT